MRILYFIFTVARALSLKPIIPLQRIQAIASLRCSLYLKIKSNPFARNTTNATT